MSRHGPAGLRHVVRRARFAGPLHVQPCGQRGRPACFGKCQAASRAAGRSRHSPKSPGRAAIPRRGARHAGSPGDRGAEVGLEKVVRIHRRRPAHLLEPARLRLRDHQVQRGEVRAQLPLLSTRRTRRAPAGGLRRLRQGRVPHPRSPRKRFVTARRTPSNRPATCEQRTALSIRRNRHAPASEAPGHTAHRDDSAEPACDWSHGSAESARWRPRRGSWCATS